MKTVQLHKETTCGIYGSFQIEITVGASTLPNLETEEIWTATHEAVKRIKSAIMEEIVKNDPEAVKRASEEKKSLLDLFPGNPFVETIPNGYCSDWCCKHLLWFVVTTQVGRIKIGWRKRVIEIDWSQTHRTKNAYELFKGEQVTKEDRMIHAWSLKGAKRYINAIIESEAKS